MPNSFGNDKSFMITDFQPGGPARLDSPDETGKDSFDLFVAGQREQGCTCRWQLANGTRIDRKENPAWDECPIHGL